MNLPPEVVRKILVENYLRIRGPVKQVNIEAAISYAEALNAEVKDRSDIDAARKKDITDSLEFFKSNGKRA
jgi:hypothetical protein